MPDTFFEYPVDGILDLHTFKPSEVKELIPEYIAVCLSKGIMEIRIIHGKGSGALRKTVISILSELPEVASYRQAPGDAGGWGATLVRLQGKEDTLSI